MHFLPFPIQNICKIKMIYYSFMWTKIWTNKELFFQDCSIAVPSFDAENVGDALELWKLTERAVGLSWLGFNPYRQRDPARELIKGMGIRVIRRGHSAKKSLCQTWNKGPSLLFPKIQKFFINKYQLCWISWKQSEQSDNQNECLKFYWPMQVFVVSRNIFGWDNMQHKLSSC